MLPSLAANEPLPTRKSRVTIGSDKRRSTKINRTTLPLIGKGLMTHREDEQEKRKEETDDKEEQQGEMEKEDEKRRKKMEKMATRYRGRSTVKGLVTFEEVIDHKSRETFQQLSTRTFYSHHRRKSFMENRGKLFYYKDKESFRPEASTRFVTPPLQAVWLKAVRSVVLMMAAYTAISRPWKRSERVTEKSIRHEMKSDVIASKMTFDVRQYRRRTRGIVPKEFVDALAKPYDRRSRDDMAVIYSLVADVEVIRAKFERPVLWRMARFLRYAKYGKDRVLTRENRAPILVYFLYSGEAHFVMDGDNDDNGKKKKGGSDKRLIALLQGDCIGAARKTRRCVCASECEFLTIERRIFDAQGFVEAEEREVEERMEFFRKWPPIEHWSDGAVYDLAHESTTDSRSGDSLLLYGRREEALDLVYFVLAGRVDVVRICRMPKVRLFRAHSVKTVRTCLGERTSAASVDRSPRPDVRRPLGEVIYARAEEDHRKGVYKKVRETFGRPLYLKVRTLIEGDSYGLDKMRRYVCAPRDWGRFSLIGRNSRVIATPVKELERMMDILGADTKELEKARHRYPSNEELYQEIVDSHAKEREMRRILKKAVPGFSALPPQLASKKELKSRATKGIRRELSIEDEHFYTSFRKQF